MNDFMKDEKIITANRERLKYGRLMKRRGALKELNNLIKYFEMDCLKLLNKTTKNEIDGNLYFIQQGIIIMLNNRIKELKGDE